MAAKKMASKAPAKKMASKPASAADFRKADQKSMKKYNSTYGADTPKRAAYSKYSDAQATAVLKKAFMENAVRMNLRGNLGTPKNLALKVDNVMGDTFFEGQEASDIGYDRANKILRQNREKWITPLYKGSQAVNKRYPKKK